MDDITAFADASRRLGVPFPIDNFYMPLVKPAEATHLGNQPFIKPERLFDRDTVTAFARFIAPHYSPDVLRHEEVRAMGIGQGYGEIDASIYNSVVRAYQPDLIVEVGAGISTYYARNAWKCRIVCIEPYPSDAFEVWAAANNVELWKLPLQEAAARLTFPRKSILFVDSTHVAKITSELHFVFLDLLPKLQQGNLIHFHDIFLPFACVHPGHNLYAQTVNWYESVLLAMFLCASKEYETVLPQYWMPADPILLPELENAIPPYAKTHAEGSSYWIRKTTCRP